MSSPRSNSVLHTRILFIADSPSKANVSPEVPLVGTKSYKTFLGWCADMCIDVTLIQIFNRSDKPLNHVELLNAQIKKGNMKVVALGAKAMKYLVDCEVEEFFSLPHPSGLNRLLNSPKFVKQKLEQCKDYIYG